MTAEGYSVSYNKTSCINVVRGPFILPGPKGMFLFCLLIACNNETTIFDVSGGYVFLLKYLPEKGIIIAFN